MAPTSTTNTSSIARALAGMTESVNIPNPPRDADFWAGKDSFAAVTARSAPTQKRAAGLPTPPNSLSPEFSPALVKDLAKVANGPPTPPGPNHVDSDVDLDDAVEHAKAQDSPQRGLTAHRLGKLADLDAVGAITPTMLAKHHLPDILLEHGPLAIRHVMGFLTTSVPGFSGIPPAKARRLVVGALEGRGSDGQQGGIKSDVVFEKVGWGRWDARKRGQPHREGSNRRGSPALRGIHIPVHSTHRKRSGVDGVYGSHQDSDMAYDTPNEDNSILEHEADKMSLDGSSECTSDDDKPVLKFNSGDVTDEEDWASIGAAALRQGSLPSTGGLMPTSSRSYQRQVDPKSRGRGAAARPAQSSISKSMPLTNSIFARRQQQQQMLAQRSPAMIPEDAFREGDAQDREAVEALLKLSSF